MTWNSTTTDVAATAKSVVLWIKTARAAGYGGQDWLPSDADISKSALFERIRSGKAPLPYPPPVGYSCPWYAVVEDPGPHFVSWHDEPSSFCKLDQSTITIMQTSWAVVEKISDIDYILKDGYRETPYRFRYWFDADWRHPRPALAKRGGGWFIRNLEFEGGKDV
jgi:hypothetical protein